MAKKRSLIQRVPLAPVFAAMFGTAAAILVAATPQWLFDATIASSGLGKLMGVAQPPLGIKARLLAIVVAAAVAALAGWLIGGAVDRLLFGPRLPKMVEDDDELDLGHFAEPPSLAETPRRPIFADRELGAPLMSDEALATAAAYAEPLAAFDPPASDGPSVDDAPLVLDAAVLEPEVPDLAEPVVAQDPVLDAPLAIEEFDVPSVLEEPGALPGESSIDALIRRLEAGLARRAGPQPPHPGAPVAAVPDAVPRDWLARDTDTGSVDEDTTRALGTLRRMAS